MSHTGVHHRSGIDESLKWSERQMEGKVVFVYMLWKDGMGEQEGTVSVYIIHGERAYNLALRLFLSQLMYRLCVVSEPL